MIVYGVHAVRTGEVRATEVVFSGEDAACEHAAQLSTDPGVLGAAVARLTVNTLGTRRNVALFVGGVRQQVPHISDDRSLSAGGAQRKIS